MTQQVQHLQTQILRLLRASQVKIALTFPPLGFLLLYIAIAIPEWNVLVSVTAYILLFFAVGCVWWMISIERQIRNIKKMIRGEIPLSTDF